MLYVFVSIKCALPSARTDSATIGQLTKANPKQNALAGYADSSESKEMRSNETNEAFDLR